MNRFLYVLIPLLIFALSCSQKKEINPPIPDATFIDFYTDYMIIQDENKFFELDSLSSQKRFDSLYQHYGVTKQQVEATRTEYNKDLAKWQTTYEKIMVRIDSIEALKQPKSPFN